jgi:serine/threonine protein phosphatase 1
MNRFVISDIHGAFKALKQCLFRSGFNYKNDLLICLGDTADGYPEVEECFDELMKIENLIYILGNHDDYLLKFFNNGLNNNDWLYNGGKATHEIYKERRDHLHKEFLNQARSYYELDEMLFVHAGFNLNEPISEQDSYTLMWDRELFYRSRRINNKPTKLTNYRKVFLGHTPTLNKESEVPIIWNEFRFIDTGAGYGYKVSIMNIDTDEFFQSDDARELYGFEVR